MLVNGKETLLNEKHNNKVIIDSRKIILCGMDNLKKKLKGKLT